MGVQCSEFSGGRAARQAVLLNTASARIQRQPGTRQIRAAPDALPRRKIIFLICSPGEMVCGEKINDDSWVDAGLMIN